MILILSFVLLFTAGVLYAETAYVFSYKTTGDKVKSNFTSEFESRGYTIKNIDSDTFGIIKNAKGQNNVIIFIDSKYFPVEYCEIFVDFLKKGNHFVAVSGYPFTETLQKVNNQWIESGSIGEIVNNAKSNNFIEFNSDSVSKMQVTSASGKNKTNLTAEIIDGRNVLCLKTKAVELWEGYYLYDIPKTDIKKTSYITFEAKGDKTSPEIWIGFMEKDGSRWLSKQKLSDNWKKYNLSASDFAYWNDSSSVGRGKEGDKLNLQNIDRLEIAFMASPDDATVTSPVTTLMGRPQNVAISNISFINIDISFAENTLPNMESLYPLHNMHLTDVNEIISMDGTELYKGKQIRIQSPLWRNKGLGSDYSGLYRQIPIAIGYDDKNLRGIAAQVLLNLPNGVWNGSMWAYVGNDLNFLEKNEKYTDIIVNNIVDKLSGRLYFTAAGSDEFSYLLSETTNFGCKLRNDGDRKQVVSLNIKVVDDSGKEVYKENKEINLLANTSVDLKLGKKVFPRGIYKIYANLYQGGEIIDSLVQGFSVFDPKSRNADNSVSQRDGNFWLKGKKWVPYGINYWPLYTSGRVPEEYFVKTWLNPEQYDPEMIERDLTILKSINVNCISVQFTHLEEAKQVRDLLERCNKYGIKVHLFTNGTHPLGLNLEFAEDILKNSNAGDSEAVFCYDLGWEVNAGNHNSRLSLDADWNNWVIDQYGSFDNAINDWGFLPSKENGLFTNPTDEMMKEPQKNQYIYIAAYRRFMDDRISKGYQTVIKLLRKYDKYSLMSARSGYGGTGAIWVSYMMPFDLKSGVRHLDYTAPEAYNIGGDRKGFLKGNLNNIYGRFVSNGKPVMWPEYGSPLFINADKNKYYPGLGYENLEKEADYYKGIADFLSETNANGGLGWWFVGGYRVDEKSDFGIVNADGTIRPAGMVYKKTFKDVTKGYDAINHYDEIIEIDRDKYAVGYAGIFDEVSSKIADLTMAGKKVGLKTPGTNTTSANTPMVAVGNTVYNGKNPIKYLNSEFNWIKINGTEIFKSVDTAIELKAGSPIIIEASVANTEESLWLSSSEKGTVGLVVSYGNKADFYKIESDTAYLKNSLIKNIRINSAPNTIMFRMRADGVADFGEIIKVNLKYIK